MWIVDSTNRYTNKIISVWYEKLSNGKFDIRGTFGVGSEDEFWNYLGTYSEERAKEIYDDINCAIENGKILFRMPKE